MNLKVESSSRQDNLKDRPYTYVRFLAIIRTFWSGSLAKLGYRRGRFIKASFVHCLPPMTSRL